MERVINGTLVLNRDVREKEFAHRKDIKTLIIIGEHKVGSEGFYGCSNLKNAYLGSYHIGYSAFQDCKKLESVHFTCDSILVQSYAFYRCYALKRVVVDWINCLDCSMLGNNSFQNVPRILNREDQ